MLIHLMDVYSYIFVIKCHLCISEKLCFYTVYIAVILLLDSCMEATICRKKDSISRRKHFENYILFQHAHRICYPDSRA